MITTQDVRAAALGWVGVPFAHQGRSKEHGVDCVGLVLCVSRQLGLLPVDTDVTGYRRAPDGSMLRLCDEWMDRAPLADSHVAAVRFSVAPQHLAFLLPRNDGLAFVHALERSGAVVVHRVDETWRRRIVASYRLRGVD